MGDGCGGPVAVVSRASDAGASRADLRPRSRDSRICGTRSTCRIVERAAALFPPLGNAAGWSARFGRELNASDDRGVHPRRTGVRSCRSSRASISSRFASRSTRVRHRISAADARRAAAIGPSRASAPRVSRRRERDEPADAHRRRPSGALRVDAHGVLPAHAAAVRARSTFSAACSTASSSTISSACA